MAKSFSTLKDPKLGLLDTITFGKLKDCRVCDVIQDHYEYLIWAEKQGYVKFEQIVIETIQEAAHFEKWTEPTEEPEYKNKKYTTYVNDFFDDPKMDFSDWTEDVPF